MQITRRPEVTSRRVTILRPLTEPHRQAQHRTESWCSSSCRLCPFSHHGCDVELRTRSPKRSSAYKTVRVDPDRFLLELRSAYGLPVTNFHGMYTIELPV